MQNFVGTLTVDSIGVGMAAFGFLNPLLAAFKTDDVKRLTIRHGEQTLLFVKAKGDEKDKEKSKEKWRLEQPSKIDVDPTAVYLWLSWRCFSDSTIAFRNCATAATVGASNASLPR